MKKNELYTLVIDFKGGTYITQALADNLSNAPVECIKNLDIKGIETEIGEKEKIEILLQLKDEKLVPLNGMKNVWCGCVTLNKKLMLMNLIRTKRDA